jgi:hypothetical protein
MPEDTKPIRDADREALEERVQQLEADVAALRPELRDLSIRHRHGQFG